MGEFMDELKARRDSALVRFQRSQQHLNAAQMEHNAATQEYNSWHFAWQAEVRRLAIEVAAAQAAKQVGPPSPAPSIVQASTPDHGDVPEVNKTDLVRNILRQNLNGITPTEIGRALKNNNVAAAYVYSVLKRLKDHDEVTKKRGKYYLRQPQGQSSEEVSTQNGVMVQH